MHFTQTKHSQTAVFFKGKGCGELVGMGGWGEGGGGGPDRALVSPCGVPIELGRFILAQTSMGSILHDEHVQEEFILPHDVSDILWYKRIASLITQRFLLDVFLGALIFKTFEGWLVRFPHVAPTGITSICAGNGAVKCSGF